MDGAFVVRCTPATFVAMFFVATTAIAQPQTTATTNPLGGNAQAIDAGKNIIRAAAPCATASMRRAIAAVISHR
jgi:hypothetical protein